MRINRIYNIAIHHIQIKWHLTRKIPGKVSFFSIFNFHLFEKFSLWPKSKILVHHFTQNHVKFMEKNTETFFKAWKFGKFLTKIFTFFKVVGKDLIRAEPVSILESEKMEVHPENGHFHWENVEKWDQIVTIINFHSERLLL